MRTKISLLLCLSLVSSSAFAALPATGLAPEGEDFSQPAPISVTPIRASADCTNTVIRVELVVDGRGLPERVTPLGLLSVEMQESVVAAVKKWKFRPATRNGLPVSVRVILPLKFTTEET